jgi:hypothetical protein
VAPDELPGVIDVTGAAASELVSDVLAHPETAATMARTANDLKFMALSRYWLKARVAPGALQ